MQGKIIKGIAGFYYVHTASDDSVYECKAKGAFRNMKIKPLVGDDVEFDITDAVNHNGNVIDILPRRNELIRPAVANIDQAMIVFASVSPEPNLNLLTRFMINMDRSGINTVICFNKTDQAEDLLTPQETIRLFTSGEEIIPISARTGANLDRLIQELTRTVNLNTLNTSDVIVSNVRHYEALRNARTAIERVNEGLESGLSGEFISQDIRECLHYLGEITGEITTDEVLGNIFKNFCIGK